MVAPEDGSPGDLEVVISHQAEPLPILVAHQLRSFGDNRLDLSHACRGRQASQQVPETFMQA
jgi:hypothetical protein